MGASVFASSDAPTTRRLGEIIETTTVGFWTECDAIDGSPPLGAVVCTSCRNGDEVVAIVSLAMTAGIDETRRAVRRGSTDVQDEAVYERHPELGHVLRTVFQAIPVGYRREGRFRPLLPPVPPPLHFSVAEAGRHDVMELALDPRHLSLLLQNRESVPVDQLVIAHIRLVQEMLPEDPFWSERAAREIARLLRHDYDRLLPILEQIDPDA
jgi:hypothetical protein